jgi:predicted transcriptional regulator
MTLFMMQSALWLKSMSGPFWSKKGMTFRVFSLSGTICKKSLLSSPVITASPHDSVQQCMETMTSCRCRHLPVVEGEKLLGIVSIGDLVKKMLEEKEEEVEKLNQYIAGSY